MPKGGGSQKPLRSITEIKHGRLRWLNVLAGDKKALLQLKREFNFSDQDLRDTLPPLQRHKIFDRGKYIFMVLLFPFYDRKSGELRPSEVDFFIGKNFLVTVHAQELEPLTNLFKTCGIDSASRNICLNSDPATLLYEILSRELNDASRMLVHLSNDIDEIEKKIFSEFEKTTIWTLLRIKTNIVNFRRSMQSHKLIVNRLLEMVPRFFATGKLENYSRDLVLGIQEIWDLLDNYKDTVDALHSTNVSLIDFRTNMIMKTLTIIAVITFPLTLFATLFATDLPGMPFRDLSYGFWVVVGIIVAGALAMFEFFEKKKWL